ncbi:helix-turn-helix domain-containing protein [Domibacillus sp. A3M-37]|uniref:helix-turn-helix domain-containing protein n=1 Tax=Domibacillus sp. A3M-37 TaxID=2962037 RepID=UPI0020B8E14C|nr:helix-turn-helix domain-containing protein [Domibacillus sp. A3M-37]MCP3765005.1 helix-turn-helix domain-containing protein [Domibacillus sp. A3M-37]
MEKGLTITDNHGWTLEQLKAYEKTVKKASMAKRVAVIRLIMEGYYACEASKLLNVHRDTISAYVRNFNRGGMDALLHRGSSPGKPPLLSPEQEAEVRQMIEHSTPAEEGFGCKSSWDTRILKHVLEEKYAITMTRMGIGKMLKRWGFSYTRPTYTLRPIPGSRPPFKKSWT